MINELLKGIYQQHPTQHKKIEMFFKSEPAARDGLINFLDMYSEFMEKEGISVVDLSNSYASMISQMMYCRIRFLQSGVYLSSSQLEAFEQVYNDPTVMTQYMLGAALSQFLWKAHYDLLNFYKRKISDIEPDGKFLEIGCGHGIYVNHLLGHLGTNGILDVVDISETSIYLAKNIIRSVNPNGSTKINFIHSDIKHYNTDTRYDFIGIGEVLEHVDDPVSILQSLYNLLEPQGKLYITTCANCPTIDHVYLFNNVSEITDMYKKVGFEIEAELSVPSENKSQDYLDKHKVDVSHGAILTRKA